MKFEQFIKKIEKTKTGVRLPDNFKSETQEKLLNFIELRPLAPRIKKISISHFPFFNTVPVMAGILILMVGTMGVSFAAEKSLPGQLLYPIKVNFNEEIIGALNIAPTSKANWETKRVERRLIESNKLSLADELEEKSSTSLEEKFEEHANKVEERIEMMKEKGRTRDAASLATRFESSLKAHEQILEKMEERGKVSGPLASRLKEKLANIEAKRILLENEIEIGSGEKELAKSAAEGKLKAAENVVREVDSFLENRREKMSVTSFAEAEKNVQEAEELISQAKENIENGLFGEAFNAGNEAIKISQESKLFVEARIELNLAGDTEPAFGVTSISAPTSTSEQED